MKYARLVWSNLMRSKRRTLLTLASVAVAFFLFATLASVLGPTSGRLRVPDDAIAEHLKLVLATVDVARIPTSGSAGETHMPIRPLSTAGTPCVILRQFSPASVDL